MIEGVRIQKLKVVRDERGKLMEILRSDDEIFERFGQVYITTAKPGVVKAWHMHSLQTDHFACLSGRTKVALYDNRESSKTYREINEFIMSPDEPFLLKIPNKIYHGFKCVSDTEAMILNIPTLPYNRRNPDEYRLDAYQNDIPYDWSK